METVIVLLFAFTAVAVGAALDKVWTFHKAGLARLRADKAQPTATILRLRLNHRHHGDPAA